MQKKPPVAAQIEVLNQSLDHIIQELGIERNPSQLSPAFTTKSKSDKAVQLDIQINGADSGVQLANRLADLWNIPFVLLNSDTDNRASAAASINIPKDYLNGSKEMLIKALTETALQNGSIGNSDTVTENRSPKVADAIFVKDTMNYVKVPFQTIDFVKSDGNYIAIHWGDKKSVLKRTLKSLEEKLPDQLFFHVHRSYLVNINKITTIGSSYIIVNQEKIPIAKNKKEELLNVLNTIC
jgi:DNA-binding LytR/AlgR family response regulator